jgi:hypothetical protein
MNTDSIYNRGGSGMTRGGLDRFLGPQAEDYSNLPEHIEQAEAEPDERKLDCENADREEPVCQIAKSEQEKRGTDSAT